MSLQTTGRLGRAVNDARLAQEAAEKTARYEARQAAFATIALDAIAEGDWISPVNKQLAAVVRDGRAAGTPDEEIYALIRSISPTL